MHKKFSVMHDAGVNGNILSTQFIRDNQLLSEKN